MFVFHIFATSPFPSRPDGIRAFVCSDWLVRRYSRNLDLSLIPDVWGNIPSHCRVSHFRNVVIKNLTRAAAHVCISCFHHVTLFLVYNTVHGRTFPCPQKPSVSQLSAECVNVRWTEKQRNLTIKRLSALSQLFVKRGNVSGYPGQGILSQPFRKSQEDWVIGTTGIP